jgi:hypothetical protein
MKGSIVHMYRRDFSIDQYANIRGTCPIEYAVSATIIEFSFGGPRDCIHFAFDAAALQNLMELGREALEKHARLTEQPVSDNTVSGPANAVGS